MQEPKFTSSYDWDSFVRLSALFDEQIYLYVINEEDQTSMTYQEEMSWEREQSNYMFQHLIGTGSRKIHIIQVPAPEPECGICWVLFILFFVSLVGLMAIAANR